MIRVVVIAPTLAVRAGLQALLQAGAGVEVIAEASSLAALSALPAGTDLLLLGAAEVDGADLRRLLSTTGAVSVLLLLEAEQDGVRALFDLPGLAWGLLPLDCSAEELLAAVNALHEGLLVGSPALLQPLLGRPLSRVEAEEGDLHIDPLTERESQVLQLLAQGLANKQIAVTLGISEHTVKFHVSAIFSKLGATSRTEAVRLGARRGWVIL